MPEVTATETAKIPTEAAPSTEVAAAVLLGTPATETKTMQPTTETVPVKPAVETTEVKPAATEVKPVIEGAPEKYEFKAPEGKEAYDPSLIAAFEAGAKDANLPQEAAQKLLDQMAPKIAERQNEQVAAIRKEWFEASKTDTEFGGTGLEQNLGIAKTALDNFGSPELNKLLVSTGLGNHPEVIRMMYKVGKAISQDTFVAGSAPERRDADFGAVLYDKTKKE